MLMQQSTKHLFRTCLFGLIVLITLSSTSYQVLAQSSVGPQSAFSLPFTTNAASPPVPSGLVVRQDDRVATLQWNVQANRSPAERPPNVSGYRITWGPTSQPDANSRLTIYNIVQLQPIENGKPYVARVQAVDNYGNVSAASAPIQFTGDPSRVDALRSRMNGFFDDFNLSPGAPDELKWNTAYSLCNADWSNGYFINNQSHVHNSIRSENCDRAQQVNRARVPLDLSDNGTRTIVFDLDGVFRRNHWYLDLVPDLVDITGPEKYPPGTLRFTQGNQGINISIFDNTGTEVMLKSGDLNVLRGADGSSALQIPNVRRRWEIQLRRDSVRVSIDGIPALATDPGTIQLKHDRYHALWTVFSYNTAKANQPFVLAHWDNFGFDAPVGTTASTVTHNYKLNNSGSDNINLARWDHSSPATVKLNIPDPVEGATARRLMFTLQMKGNNVFKWTPTDQVKINGYALPIPQPTSNTIPPRVNLIDSYQPYTVQIPIPEGALRQGENELTFDAESSGILNIHAELDFPATSAATYTPPSEAAAGSPLPTIPAVGPNLYITKIGSTTVDIFGETIWEAKNFNPTVNGVVPVSVQISNDTALEATGTNAGVILVELLVDRKVVMSQSTNNQSPAPSVSHTFNLDTRQLTNGTHEVFIRAYDPRCTTSILDYGGASVDNGQYLPLHVMVQNAGGRVAQAEATTAAVVGPYTVSVPMAMLSNGAACANAKVSNSVSPVGGPRVMAQVESQDRLVRREDELTAPSVQQQFFICD